MYQLDDERAIAVSIDVITPLVDDPETFGRIAAANALSDLYAMGATGLVSLSFLAVPKNFDLSIATAIARGGALTALDAGAPVLGGHTVESQDLMFGLAVVGELPPNITIRNMGLRPGDQLLLSKPLGTGTLTTALKEEKLTADDISEATAGMMQLNAAAVPLLRAYRGHISAVTDITGFGLIGHAAEMARGSGVAMALHGDKTPAYAGARQTLAQGVVTRGNARNLRYASSLGPVENRGELEKIDPLLLDPQTSGGLLIGVAADRADALRNELIASGFSRTALVGEVSPGEGLLIY